MDNGLIFPYPRERAHAEPGNAKHVTSRYPFGEMGLSQRPKPVVGKLKG